MASRKKRANSAQLDIFDRPAAPPKKRVASSSQKPRKARKPKRTRKQLPEVREYRSKNGTRYQMRRLS